MLYLQRFTVPAPAKPLAKTKRVNRRSRESAETMNVQETVAIVKKKVEIVVPPKVLPTQLLGLLEDLVHTSASMNTRFAECCASALCSLVTKPTVAGPLAAVDALSRILALCGHIQQ